MATAQLKFGEPVEYQGRSATVVGVRDGVVDLAIFVEIKNGAGVVQNVVGTARQSELVQFVHDVPVDQIERTEDWFFSLSDEEVSALLKEKSRRDHAKAQADQAASAEAEKKQALEGVTIRPSDKVLQTAEKLWKDAIRADAHADEHEEIELPGYASKPDLWAPWIEKAKAFIAKESASPAQADEAGGIPIPNAVGGPKVPEGGEGQGGSGAIN